ncbi:MAG: D-2-hydroxyacid dehydrogenase family protein [Pelagibacterium sp.]|uniref:D-2-hydroxyacid dehydrogenase family protein n=1 Tax=Pelagibacterium sp. TaxID=1967288 RepID=UPI0032EEA4CF
MDDYLDFARGLDCVKEMERQARVKIHTTRAASSAELFRRLREVDIVVAVRDRVIFDAVTIANMPNVRLISVCGPRVAPHIDVAAATAHGIAVSLPARGGRLRFAHTGTVETTWNLILGLAKDVVINDHVVRSGGWQTRAGRDLAEKTLGIIGLGSIGQRVARVARAFEMNVVAWSPSLTQEQARAAGAARVELRELLAQSDIVSIHANLTPHSENLIGEAELAGMKQHALLVNTSRAALVNEAALRDALAKGVIAGAGLDVYWDEPLAENHWLRNEMNVLLQPHMGGFTKEGYAALLTPAVKNVLAFLAGMPTDVINPDALR